MNVYFIKNFPGHYPVGTAAVIVANDRVQAFGLLQKELKKNHNLYLSWQDVGPTDFKQLDVKSASVRVLLDGDY